MGKHSSVSTVVIGALVGGLALLSSVLSAQIAEQRFHLNRLKDPKTAPPPADPFALPR